MKIFGIRFIILTIFIYSTVTGYAQDASTPINNDYTIRKGRFYSSLTFSLDSRVAENEDQLIRQVIDQNKYNYKIVGNIKLTTEFHIETCSFLFSIRFKNPI